MRTFPPTPGDGRFVCLVYLVHVVCLVVGVPTAVGELLVLVA